jgi:hypothetical protein
LGQKFCDIESPAGDRSFFSETAGTSFERAWMLFNSFDFIFVFMPVTLAAFASAVRLRSSRMAVLVLLVASYVFYGYGDHFAVLLLAGSTAFNYLVGRAIFGATRLASAYPFSRSACSRSSRLLIRSRHSPTPLSRTRASNPLG